MLNMSRFCLFFAMLPLFMAITCNKDFPKSDTDISPEERLGEVLDAYLTKSMVITDLKVVQATQESISLSWKKVEGAADISYQISYRKKGQDVWSYSTTQSQNTSALKYLTPLTIYEVRVRVKFRSVQNKDKYNYGEYAQLSVTTLPAPPAPTGLKVIGQQLDGITLSWDPVPNSSDISGYYISYRRRGEDHYTIDYKTTKPIYTITGLDELRKAYLGSLVGPRPIYEIRVRVRDRRGYYSSYAQINVSSVKVSSGVKVTEIKSDGFKLSWDANVDPTLLYAISYRIKGSGSSYGAEIETTQPTYTFTGLIPGTTYEISIRTKNKHGISSYYAKQTTVTTNFKVFHKIYSISSYDDRVVDMATNSDGISFMIGTTYTRNQLEVWSKTVDNNGNEISKAFRGYGTAKYPDKIIPTLDGGFIFAGTEVLSSSGRLITWVIKTNYQGVKQWHVYAPMIFRGIISTSDGGFMVTGTRYNGGEGITGGVKIDSQGKTKWSKIIGEWPERYDRAGHFLMIPGLDDSFTILRNHHQRGDDIIYAERYNSEGRKVWSKNIGKGIYRTGTFNPNGRFILVGVHTTPADYAVGPGANNGQTAPTLAIEYGSNGNQAWRREHENIGVLLDIIYAKGGGYVLVGNSEGNSWVTKYNSSFQVAEWSKNFENVTINAITQAPDGGYILASTVRSSKGDNDIQIFKIDKDGATYN